MKRILSFMAVVLCGITAATAQTSYGLKAGVNLAKYKASGGNITFTSDTRTSFYVTGYADITVANNFSIQPGVSFQGKGGTVSGEFVGVNEKVKEDLMYIEIPVNAVYYIPTGEVGKLFFGAGPYAGLGVRVKTSAGNISESGSFDDAGLNIFDAGLNFLGGYKLNNGFLINIGYGLGLTNMMKDIEGATVKNRVWSIGVGYQF
ncbi:PorT family protein [Sphingobacterium phlebotomi]|uniref:PorT family protein n=1 Tax=Sphingobacterium phlebotomi TaxID=2605433 RepID=A0A5D4GVV4_9SPHI|nr:porin family protein [Sphingobacterium phlebotomi]TYR33001.1 PorT family protein [Sphingobacterium phlebotomi]